MLNVAAGVSGFQPGKIDVFITGIAGKTVPISLNAAIETG